MSVSYCITLFNKEAYISATLETVLAEWRQTGGEIIVYDDCSTDGSLGLAELFTTHGHVRIIRGSQNVGLMRATDRLIREANEPYLKLVDADDLLRSGSTVFLREALDRCGADLIYGKNVPQGEVARWSSTKELEAEVHSVAHAFRAFLTRIEFNVSSALFRTGAAKAALPFPDNVRIPQDLVLGLRLARQGQIAKTDRLIAIAPDISTGRLSRQTARMYADFCRIIDGELEHWNSATDAAFAARRNARRCLRYFRRFAPGSLGSRDRLWLVLQAVAPAWQSITASRNALRKIDTIYRRDIDRVLG
jgi:glycosyltransferase involved in cell wall biosynthesis